MAVMTKAVNKPFYVVAESFKFVRLYPLNQEDVPNHFKVSTFFYYCGPSLSDVREKNVSTLEFFLFKLLGRLKDDRWYLPYFLA